MYGCFEVDLLLMIYFLEKLIKLLCLVSLKDKVKLCNISII